MSKREALAARHAAIVAEYRRRAAAIVHAPGPRSAREPSPFADIVRALAVEHHVSVRTVRRVVSSALDTSSSIIIRRHR